ncbi:MAG: internal scaffolding protein [Microvirus sp.]|nr:MAG: internal scaffolding protein [Microvirus sp.]
MSNSQTPNFPRVKHAYSSHEFDEFGITFTDLSRTKQQFKDECDINVIMARYQDTGVLDFVNKHSPQFLDATGQDFQTSMQTVADARSMFMDLPSSLREKFQNDPAQFLDFVHDEKNLPEMAEMGLLRPDYVPPAPSPANGGAEPSAPSP